MTTTSNYEPFDDIRGNRFIYMGVLYGVYKFIDSEGFKSQPLAFVGGNNELGFNYLLIEN